MRRWSAFHRLNERKRARAEWTAATPTGTTDSNSSGSRAGWRMPSTPAVPMRRRAAEARATTCPTIIRA